MRWKKSLYEALDIRSGEGKIVFLLIIHSIFVGIVRMMFFNAANSLFLSRFGGDLLPHAFIVTGIVGYLVGAAYSFIQKRVDYVRILYFNLIFLLISVFAFYLGIVAFDSDWIIFGLLVWFGILLSLILIEFWGLVSYILTLRQYKRLSGLIGSGEVIAAIMSSFFISVVVSIIGTANLILISALGISACLILLFVINRRFQGLLLSEPKKRKQGKKGIAGLLKNRYVLYIVFTVVFATFILYFVQYEFAYRSSLRYSEEKLAQFFGIFFGLANGLTFILKTFFSGRLLKRFGIEFGLYALPSVIIIFALFGIVNSTIMASVALFFWIIVFAKFFDWLTRYSLYDPAFRMLYQPFTGEEKGLVQTLVEGKVLHIAVSLSGLIILALKSFPASGSLMIYILLFFVSGSWIWISRKTYQQYISALTHALQKRTLGTAPIAISLQEDEVMQVIQKKLKSSNPGEVIYSVNLLESQGNDDFKEIVMDLLSHDSPLVRQAMLQKIRETELYMALPYVRNRAQFDDSPEVRAEAIKTLCALQESEAVDDIYPLLRHHEATIRSSAMVGLLRYGGIEGILPAGSMLMYLSDSTDPEDRKLAATVIGDVENRSFYRPLKKLLEDNDPAVKSRAITAAGKIGNPKLADMLVKFLKNPKFSNLAVQALENMGEDALPILAMSFDIYQSRQYVILKIIRILQRIGGKGAISILREKIDYPDKNIRFGVYSALYLSNYVPTREDRKKVRAKIQEEFADAVWSIASLVDLSSAKNKDFSYLEKALINEYKQNLKIIFYLLSFIYESDIFIEVSNLFSCFFRSHCLSKEKKAFVEEFIEVSLPKEESDVILTLIDDVTIEEKLERLEQYFPIKHLTPKERLKAIIARTDEWTNPWTKSCAIYYTVDESAEEFFDIVTEAVTSKNSLVRETAIWAAHTLDEDRYNQLSGQFADDPITLVVQTVHHLNASQKGYGNMLLTIEKVMILKTVSIFSRTSENVLAEVASILEEKVVDNGEKIIHRGDIGNCLYIIVNGKVRVHEGETTFAMLGEKEMFGEMALLDTEPRSASVTAEEKTYLLRLEQEAFYELMADRPEIAKGIIRELTQRVRELNAYIHHESS
jgi:HEAT repeat protein/ATP/ADP translocase